MLDVQASRRLKLKFHWSGRRRDLAEPDDPVEAAARLEGALERIALLAERATAARGAGTDADAIVNEAAVARRLDLLIARLRAVLDTPRT
jgi:hypothetical protein